MYFIKLKLLHYKKEKRFKALLSCLIPLRCENSSVFSIFLIINLNFTKPNHSEFKQVEKIIIISCVVIVAIY